jgi:rhodanese-related sulfurtransferase
MKIIDAWKPLLGSLAPGALAALAACGGSNAAGAGAAKAENSSAPAAYTSAVPLISLDELAQRMASKASETFVFDANGPEIFSTGHIPKAQPIAYDQVKVEALPADKSSFLVFYCWNPQCGASHQAAGTAMKLGYRNVHVYGGGIEGWKSAGKPVEKGGDSNVRIRY